MQARGASAVVGQAMPLKAMPTTSSRERERKERKKEREREGLREQNGTYQTTAKTKFNSKSDVRNTYLVSCILYSFSILSSPRGNIFSIH